MSNLKRFLAKNLPPSLRSRLFRLYKTSLNRFTDRFIFPEYRIDKNKFQLYRVGHPFRENEVSINEISDPAVRNLMKDWYGWTQEEFILHLDVECVIEPRQGWAIVPPRSLVHYSLGITRTWFIDKPDVIDWLRRDESIVLEKAISLRDTGEENYFHFYNDVIAKLFFLEANGIAVNETPVIISHKLWAKPFFAHYAEVSGLKEKINWVIQTDQYIRCRHLITCKPLTHSPWIWRKVFAPVIKPSSGSKRIFVTRDRNRSRTLSNPAEIEEVCSKFGLETVNCDSLTVASQISVFAASSFIAGLHGAALTNIIFRDPPAMVLEIFPPPTEGYLPFHYIMAAALKGLTYDAVVGLPTDDPGKFFLDPDVLTEKLVGYLGSPAP